MKRIKLTQPNGSPLHLVADNVSEFFANDGSYVRAAKSIVSMVNGHQHAVKEPRDNAKLSPLMIGLVASGGHEACSPAPHGTLKAGRALGAAVCLIALCGLAGGFAHAQSAPVGVPDTSFMWAASTLAA